MPSFKPYLLVIFFIISVAAAFLGGRFFDTLKPKIAQIPPQNINTIPKVNNQIFSKQTAEIKGQILEIKGDVMTVQDNSGTKADFRGLSQIYITSYTAKGKEASFQPINKVETKKQALIILEVNPLESSDQTTYRIIGITFFPEFPQTP